MKTKLLFLFFCCVYGTSAQAANDDGEYLYVYTNDASNAVVYSLDNLDKLTFGDNAVSIWTYGGRTDFEYGRISLMTFRGDIRPASIEPLTMDDEVKIAFERSSSLVSVEGNRLLQGVVVYDVQGRMVTADARKRSYYQVSLQGKPKGVYVIKVKGNGKSTTTRIVR